MEIEIKSRYTEQTLFVTKADSLKQAVETAVSGGANLQGADLRGADLRDADGKTIKLVGDRPFFQVGPAGSRGDYLSSFLTDAGVYIQAGCFWDTLQKFRDAVEKTHGQSSHGQEYHAAIGLIETHAALWGITNAGI